MLIFLMITYNYVKIQKNLDSCNFYFYSIFFMKRSS